MRICVDLDGVIFEKYWTGWPGEYDVRKFGDLIDGVRASLKAMKQLGHKVIIHTCRTSPKANWYYSRKFLLENVKEKLKEYELPYDEIWTDAGKPIADLYIDDRAIEFTDWFKTMDKIMDFEEK